MKHCACIRELDVLPQYLAGFLRRHAADGEWAALFRRSEGCSRTLLLDDEAQPMRFVTGDRRISRESLDAFRVRFGDACDAPDRQCEAFTPGEASLGSFVGIGGNDAVD